MSYDQWKTGMLSTSAVSAIFVVLMWFFRDGGFDVLFATALVPLLCALVVLSFRKPNRLWAVATVGTSVSTGKQIEKSFGPFHSKDAAVSFRDGWYGTYNGFAVVEHRTQYKVDKH